MRPSLPQTIGQPELSGLLGLTPRQVRNLTGEVFRIVEREGNAVFYSLAESIRAYVFYREHQVRKHCRRLVRQAARNAEPDPDGPSQDDSPLP